MVAASHFSRTGDNRNDGPGQILDPGHPGSVVDCPDAPSLCAFRPEKPRTFYGGQAMATEFYNVELLIANKSVQLFVRDRHNWPVDVRGFSATALLSKPEGSEEIDLVPGKRKALIGSTDVAGIEEVVITLNAPGRESIKLRFNRGSLEATPK